MNNCNSSSIQRLQFYTRKPTWSRLDVLPFAVAYAMLSVNVVTSSNEPSVVPGVTLFELSLALFAVCVVLNIVVYLSSFWSVGAEAFVTCVAVSDPRRATLVRVTPTQHRGRAVITALRQFEPTASTALMMHDASIDGTIDEHGDVTYFEYQRRVFKYDATDGVFRKPSYPIGKPLSSYMSCEGYDSDETVKACAER
jgi:hypothetical protein